MRRSACAFADPAGWSASDFPDPDRYRFDLSFMHPVFDEIVGEIRRRDMSLETLDPAFLPIGGLDPAAQELLARLAHGVGFCLLTGIAGSERSEEEAAMLYWLLGCAMGLPMPQNRAGDRLGVVEDRSHIEAQPRGYLTREPLTFHTDVADIVGLMCIRGAKSGGRSKIASAISIYNIMQAERPDLLKPLARGYFYDRAGEAETADTITDHRIPVFSDVDGKLSARLYRPLAELGMCKAGMPFTDIDREAFEFIERTANRSDVMLELTIKPGEILMFNNYTVLHARTSFVDFREPERRRKLLRQWLEVPGFRSVRPELAMT